MSESDEAHATSHPFAVWQVFRGLPRWYFARGCPPTIEGMTGWTRVLHVSVLLAAMGLVASACGLGCAFAAFTIASGEHIPSTILGCCLGSLVLFPLSRWVRRSNWHTALAIPFATAWCTATFSLWDGIQLRLSDHPWRDDIVALTVFGFFGTGMTLWMCSRREPRTWWSIPLVVLTLLVMAVESWLLEPLEKLFPSGLILDNAAVDTVLRLQPLVLFLTMVSVTLGIRLWSTRVSAAEDASGGRQVLLADVFAVWTVFRGIHRWYFARGCPPTLASTTGWTRRVQSLVLLGTMGLVSSWVSTLWLALERMLENAMPFSPDGTLAFSPGAWFGLLVLMPLSRWLGRGWLASVPLAPVSVGVYYVAVILFVRHAFGGAGFEPKWFDAALCGLWGGAGVSVWFVRLTKPRTWPFVPWVSAVGGFATAVMTNGLNESPPPFPFGLEVLRELLGMNLLLSPFQITVAMALGVRLWWPDVSQPSPRPAANTAETSTVNPGNSTDDAVSPGLNSP